jgi:hypothetical protein
MFGPAVYPCSLPDLVLIEGTKYRCPTCDRPIRPQFVTRPHGPDHYMVTHLLFRCHLKRCSRKKDGRAFQRVLTPEHALAKIRRARDAGLDYVVLD